MRIVVGSANPVKKAAVEAVVGDATVDAIAVPSGVPEQPRGHAETIAGAQTRAWEAFDTGGDESAVYDYGVGLEGGVASFDGADDLYLVMWAAVTDGVRVGRGAGPSVRLPSRVAVRIRNGEELGPVMDDVLGTDDIAKKEGAAGALTGGRIDRETALSTAVAGAFGPFVSELY
ncbi:hypothetical protein AUR64_08430 [Haloprofundus marisrubri]|uniref:inosine/xanthosine triphosphatase n=1 Tax=Haloprofundus marisrubri TaxID=1514971 RepID=A0A0W1R8H8_9EURY|nr:inosine/xanthosine triphosphatase [Haloprofundus marisrubri]KTG09661.1 hypothetical protein AUR64_08430 [Haloprofundus marisrubri]